MLLKDSQWINQNQSDLSKNQGDTATANEIYNKLGNNLWSEAERLNRLSDIESAIEDKKNHRLEAINCYFDLLGIVRNTTNDPIEIAHIHYALATNYLFISNVLVKRDKEETFKYKDLAYHAIKEACILNPDNLDYFNFKSTVTSQFIKFALAILKDIGSSSWVSLEINKLLLELDLERGESYKASQVAHRISSIYYDNINKLYLNNEALLDEIKLSYFYIEEACKIDPSSEINTKRCAYIRDVFIVILKSYVKLKSKPVSDKLAGNMLLLELQEKTNNDPDKEACICRTIASLHIRMSKSSSEDRKSNTELAFEFAERAYSLAPDQQLDIYLTACQALADALKITNEEKAIELYERCLKLSDKLKKINYDMLIHCHFRLAIIYFNRSSTKFDAENNLKSVRFHCEEVISYKGLSGRLIFPDQSTYMLIITLLNLASHYEKILKEDGSNNLFVQITGLYSQALDLASSNKEEKILLQVKNQFKYFQRHFKEDSSLEINHRKEDKFPFINNGPSKKNSIIFFPDSPSKKRPFSNGKDEKQVYRSPHKISRSYS